MSFNVSSAKKCNIFYVGKTINELKNSSKNKCEQCRGQQKETYASSKKQSKLKD
jgi:hypothetical protein